MIAEPWVGLFIVYFTGHAFALGFFLGTRYVTSVSNPDRRWWRPAWLQDAIDAYALSHRRPLSADELTAYDWDDRDESH